MKETEEEEEERVEVEWVESNNFSTTCHHHHHHHHSVRIVIAKAYVTYNDNIITVCVCMCSTVVGKWWCIVLVWRQIGNTMHNDVDDFVCVCVFDCEVFWWSGDVIDQSNEEMADYVDYICILCVCIHNVIRQLLACNDWLWSMCHFSLVQWNMMIVIMVMMRTNEQKD